MKIGLLAARLLAASLFLTSGLVSAANAATITMSPPDPQNKPAAKLVQPSVQPAPAPAVAPKAQPPIQVQTAPLQPLPQSKPVAPVVVEAEPAPKVIAAPPPAQQTKAQAAAQTKPAQGKPDCPCDCPPKRKAHRNAAADAAPRYARAYDYRYQTAAPFGWHGPWRVPPAPGPMAYGPRYETDGLRIEDRGWTGGVGTEPDGGGGGGFVDGYGQVHFANGGSVENGPTYNSYGQSFPYNPSQAGPFQPRLMGGFAPPSR